jgi:hypothetical protein
MYKPVFCLNKIIRFYQKICKKYFQEKNFDTASLFLFAVFCMIVFSISETYAIQTDALKAPMQTLKKEAFDWAFALKIAAGLVGAVTSLIKQTPTPFVIGLSSMAGLSFFDSYIGDGSSALIR